MCVCVRARARTYECLCVRVHACARVCVCACVRARACARACVRVHALRIVTTDKILRFINILINIIITLSPVNHTGLLYKG